MPDQPHHFCIHVPEKLPCAIEPYTDNARLLYRVINKRLAHTTYVGVPDYSSADIAIFGWLDEFARRPAVQRGVGVLAGARRPLTDEKAREALFGQRQIDQR